MKFKSLLIFLLLGVAITSSLMAQPNYCSLVKTSHIQFPMPEGAESIQEVLMNKYDVKFYYLNVNVESSSTYISGWVSSTSIALSSLDTFAFELYSGMSVDSVFSGVQKLNFTRSGNFVFARLLTTAAQGSSLNMKVYYHGTPPTPGTAAIGAGFTNANGGSTGFKYTYSLSQPYSAEEWWPCKQSLRDKIDSCWVFITTDTANKAGSNGVLRNVVNLGAKKRYEWKHSFPIDYYLISVAVGNYYDYSIYAYPVNTPPILIQSYVYNTTANINTVKPQFDKTKSMIELYSKLLGPYWFATEKYGHCQAPISGGMEHQTMTSLGVINFEVIAHELGHQWFGDQVTCGTWADIWVNEGFATYIAYMAYQYLDTANAPGYMVNAHNSAMSAPDGSVYCTDTTSVGRIFSSRLSYQKGCSIIHMIRYELHNDTVFFNVLKEYQRRFKGSTATGLDFKKVIEDVSGKDFTRFFNQWYFGEGYPTYNAYWNQLGQRFSLIMTQSTSMPSSVNLFQTPVEVRVRTTKKDTVIVVNFQKNVQGYAFTFVDSVISVQVDASNWLLCKSFVNKDPNQLPLGMGNTMDHVANYTVFPNPTHDYLNIEGLISGERVRYQIVDMEGRNLSEGFFDASQKHCSTSFLSAGVYFIKLYSGNGSNSTTQRFVVY